MNLENFRQVYKSVITESQDDRKFVNYIKSIVEEILTESKGVTVDNTNYPNILKAINNIRMDSQYDTVTEFELTSKKYTPEALRDVNDSLGKLSDDDFETLTIGDVDDAKDIVKKNPTLKMANTIFNGVFNDLNLFYAHKEEKTVKNKSKYGIAEAHKTSIDSALDGGPYVDSYGPGPLTMDTIGMVSGYKQGDYNMPMIPMEYDLEKIEAALTAAKDKMTEEEYKDFIYLDTDDDAVIQILFDYRNIKNLKQASKFLNFIKEN